MDETERAHYIEAAKSEIERLRRVEQRPGWTSWALGLAIAALVWKIVSILGSDSITDLFWHYLLVLLLVRDTVVSLIMLCDLPFYEFENQPKLVHKYIVETIKPSVRIFHALLLCITIYAAKMSPIFVSAWAFNAVVFLYSFGALFNILLAVISMRPRMGYVSNDAINKRTLHLIVIGFVIAIIGIAIVAIVSIVNLVRSGMLEFDSDNVQLAAIAMACILLCWLWRPWTAEPPLEKELHRILQRLQMGNYGNDDLRVLKLATTGISASEYLKEGEIEISNLVDDVRRSIGEMDKSLAMNKLRMVSVSLSEVDRRKVFDEMKDTNFIGMTCLARIKEYLDQFEVRNFLIKDLVTSGLSAEDAKKHRDMHRLMTTELISELKSRMDTVQDLLVKAQDQKRFESESE